MTPDPLLQAAKQWEEDIRSAPAKTKVEAFGDPLFCAAKHWEEEFIEKSSREHPDKEDDCYEDAFMAELEQLRSTRNDPLMLAAMDWERKTLFGHHHRTRNMKHQKQLSEPSPGGPFFQAAVLTRRRRNSCTQIGEECVLDRDELERSFNNWKG